MLAVPLCALRRWLVVAMVWGVPVLAILSQLISYALDSWRQYKEAQGRPEGPPLDQVTVLDPSQCGFTSRTLS